MAPDISERAADIEQMRGLPPDLVDRLRSAGVFRMYVPRSHGGDELRSLEAIEVIEALARADGSVGWVVTIGADSPAVFTYLPSATYDAIYRDGPDVIHAGSLVPRGQAVRTDGGFRYTGQWPFASGCGHADYIAVNAFVSDPAVADGPPATRFGVLPADRVTVIDTWHVSGLCGTGSHDVALEDVFVPEEWTGSLFAAPTVHHPLDSLPLLGRLGVELGACAVGIAQGALDDVVDIGRTKRPLGGLLNRVAEDPVFQYKLGRLDMDLRTARLLVRDVARADEEVAARGTKRSDIELLERRTTLNKVAELAASVVDGAYTMCGTSGLYLGSPLQRRARDIHALTQHFILSANTYSPLGASLLGEPTNTGPF